MYHNSKILSNKGVGPFFYLSKVEGTSEARLWNDIFVWTQQRLLIPYGTIKACVLIENILSAFEMEEILYELKDHSLGLNCGIWDYAASIICKFGRVIQYFYQKQSQSHIQGVSAFFLEISSDDRTPKNNCTLLRKHIAKT